MSNGFLHLGGTVLVSLTCWFGDPDLSQRLALLVLLAEFLGRLLTIYATTCSFFRDGPCHRTLLAGLLVFTAGFCVAIRRLRDPKEAATVLMSAWCVVHVARAGLSAMVDATTVFYVPAKERKEIARQNFGWSFSGDLIGLLVASSIV